MYFYWKNKIKMDAKSKIVFLQYIRQKIKNKNRKNYKIKNIKQNKYNPVGRARTNPQCILIKEDIMLISSLVI